MRKIDDLPQAEPDNPTPRGPAAETARARFAIAASGAARGRRERVTLRRSSALALALCAGALLALLQGPAISVRAASPGAALAGQATPELAASFIDSLGKEAIKSLTASDTAPAERRRRFRDILRRSFDVAYMGRFTLGPYWRRATAKQQAEFLGLFEDFVVQAYAHRFAGYNGETLSVGQSSATDGNSFFVQSRIVGPDRPPVQINWRVRRMNGQFKIYDIMVEGISMLVTHREEFASVIQNSGRGLDGLLAALRKRTAAD